jgi:V8-like Glu-specific endopeptidase
MYTPLFKADQEYLPLYTDLEGNGMCGDQAWANEAALSNCSGTLVSDRHIVTAGHCADVEDMCAKYAWLFDYQLDENGQLPKSYSRSQVYSCKKIVKSVHSNIKIYGQFIRTDYAVVELDRPVMGRRPIELSKKKFVRPGTKVVNISYPIGTPGKISDIGTVSKYMYLPGFFWSNVMVFGGSSGSGMFNAETGELVGVVSQGVNNLEKDKVHECKNMVDVRVTDPIKNGGQVSASAQMRRVLQTLKKIGVIKK